MVRRSTASVLALCMVLGVGCGSTRAAVAGRQASLPTAGGTSADTYLTADQSNGVNAWTVVSGSGAAATDSGQGTFITP